jgi:hypothetical protein
MGRSQIPSQAHLSQICVVQLSVLCSCDSNTAARAAFDCYRTGIPGTWCARPEARDRVPASIAGHVGFGIHQKDQRKQGSGDSETIGFCFCDPRSPIYVRVRLKIEQRGCSGVRFVDFRLEQKLDKDNF